MKRVLMSAMLGLSVFATPAMFVGGCDRTVSEDKRVEQKSDGTVVKDEKKTVETPDGGTKTTKEHTVDKP
ncbi:MAG TPA: hypothetical protein VH518_24855 [Tepidisphaeraceae bacterium]|jgi:hypothetical protein